MNHVIQIKREGRQETILADRMPVGYLITDGGICVNITGVTGKHFDSRTEAVLWILKMADALVPLVRNFKLSRFAKRAA
jgi:hypothetical protein